MQPFSHFPDLYGIAMPRVTNQPSPVDPGRVHDSVEKWLAPKGKLTKPLNLKRTALPPQPPAQPDDSTIPSAEESSKPAILPNPVKTKQEQVDDDEDSGEKPSDLDMPNSKRTRRTILPPSTPQGLPCLTSSRISDFPLQPLLSDTHKLLPQFLTRLNEPGPLGLRLQMSPSLVNLIQMKLAQGQTQFPPTSTLVPEGGSKSSTLSTSQQEKLKASNFPASTLRIGNWERNSKHEGDLVVKCYYAKRKLVWEILEGGLKSKIEVLWADITALNSNYKENEPGVLEIEVSKPPFFFKETNPQPKKHTLWQSTSDFTGGQASICKWHYLQFSPGVLNKHYEQLIQFDPHLKALNDKIGPKLGPTYFEQPPHEKTKGKYTMESFEESESTISTNTSSSVVLNFQNFDSNRSPPSLLSRQPSSAYNTTELIHHPAGLAPKFEIFDLENATTKSPPKVLSFSRKDEFVEGNIDNIKKAELETMDQIPHESVGKTMLDDLAYHLFIDTGMPEQRKDNLEVASMEASLCHMESSLSGDFPNSSYIFENCFQSNHLAHHQIYNELKTCNNLNMSSSSTSFSDRTPSKSQPNYTNLPQISSLSHLFDYPLGGMEFLEMQRPFNDLEYIYKHF